MSDESEPLPVHAPPATRAPGELLREFLKARDVPCPSCGYNLRALRTEACPECGQALVLRVNLVEPRMRLWVAGLVGLAAGAGFSTLLVIYGVFAFVVGRGGGPGLWFVITIGGAAVEGGLLVLWVLGGRRIRSLSVVKRAWLAVVCMGLTLVNLLLFSVAIR